MPSIPYENQLLGAFIFALGCESGKSGTAPTVNLFQQTPLDQRFGDLIAGSQWCMAIEFKRVRQGLASERNKWSSVLAENPEQLHALKAIADRGHWVCYGTPQIDGLLLHAEPYRTIFNQIDTSARIDASELIGALARAEIEKGHPRFGVSAAALSAYLKILQALRKTNADGGPATTWLCAVAAGGQYRYATAASLDELVERTPRPVRIIQREQHRTLGRDEPDRER